MDVRILCNVVTCPNEVTEHAYCDSCFEKELDEAYERGKEDGYKEVCKETKAETKPTPTDE